MPRPMPIGHQVSQQLYPQVPFTAVTLQGRLESFYDGMNYADNPLANPEAGKVWGGYRLVEVSLSYGDHTPVRQLLAQAQ